jgi:hypothetical protein
MHKAQTKLRLQSIHGEIGRKQKSSIENAALKGNIKLSRDAEAAFLKIYAEVESICHENAKEAINFFVLYYSRFL